MSDQIDALAATLRASATGALVVTGAGISLASGIPSFRSDGGLWTRYDPERYATLTAFRERPDHVWPFLRELRETLLSAQPNDGHIALAALERRGFINSVATQNIDGLHQAAGSERVIELHGTYETARCLDCDLHFTERQLVDRFPAPVIPVCPNCAGPIKPDVVLFEEALPERELLRARRLADRCDVVLVVGTSAEVYPAAELPERGARHGAAVWEVNPEPVLPTARHIADRAERVLPLLARRLLGRGAMIRARRQARSA